MLHTDRKPGVRLVTDHPGTTPTPTAGLPMSPEELRAYSAQELAKAFAYSAQELAKVNGHCDCTPAPTPRDRIAAALDQAIAEITDDHDYWAREACGQDSEEAEESGRLIGFADGLGEALKILDA